MAASPAAQPPDATSTDAERSGAPSAEDGGLERELRWFRAALGLCFLATLLVSHRAWLSSGRDYPLVPVIDGLPQPPYPLDWLLLGAMAAALLGMSFARRPAPYLAVVLAVSGVWMVLDQTRWQPYLLTYLAGTACLLLGELPSVRAAAPPLGWHMAPFQLSLAATWAYSGLHKFNLLYVERQFPMLVGPLVTRLGVAQSQVARVMFWPGLASAALEAGLGLALLWPRTRRLAVVGLTLMHAFIMLLLGPLGHSINSVVWPWNAAVVAALWLLFWPRAASDRFDGFVRGWWLRLRGRGGQPAPPPLRLAWLAAIVFFALLPVLSFARMWDASLSFQMYAAKQQIVRIHYRPEQRATLPPAALRGERGPGEVDLHRWAMREMNIVPVLETRVVTRIGRQVARRAPDADVRVVIGGPPALLTGRREYRAFVYRGRNQLPREVDPPNAAR